MSIHQDETILEAYVTETSQLVEQLEDIILVCENINFFSEDMINEIFRIMHTIKGSSSMMYYNNIATLAHALEDLFSFLRQYKFQLLDWSQLSDLMLQGVDFTKIELEKVKNGDPVDGDASDILEAVKQLLTELEAQRLNEIERTSENEDSSIFYNETNEPQIKPNQVVTDAAYNDFEATITFTEDCDMENVRAFQIIHTLKDIVDVYHHLPEDIVEDSASIKVIRSSGFKIFMKTERTYDEIYQILAQSNYLKHLELQVTANNESREQEQNNTQVSQAASATIDIPENTGSKLSKSSSSLQQGSTINVSVSKLDELMDLVGELVIAEAMVTQNNEVLSLPLEQFHKAATHLHKITKEIQDKVMEIRMVPLATTFQKMHRVVRDMSKKLNKNVQLKLIGEETEVDKNIIERISDPIMHLVRNAIDHGIEDIQERAASNKPEIGTLTLEAQHVGGEVLIIVKDDGRGLNKDRILQKAYENEVIRDIEATMSDKDIYNLIFLPGFSTKEDITEYSGRGVGMDVVTQNIAAVGGTVSIDSVYGKGSAITIKIPLTLAIIDGMQVSVGEMKYTIATTAIKESFKPSSKEIITDPNGNEMVMVRGECYPIIRLHELFLVETEVQHINNGILIMVEQDSKKICLFVDQLLGQQQVVVKALPAYIRKFNKVEGISGCTLLGDGDISLILDIQGLLKRH